MRRPAQHGLPNFYQFYSKITGLWLIWEAVKKKNGFKMTIFKLDTSRLEVWFGLVFQLQMGHSVIEKKRREKSSLRFGLVHLIIEDE